MEVATDKLAYQLYARVKKEYGENSGIAGHTYDVYRTLWLNAHDIKKDTMRRI